MSMTSYEKPCLEVHLVSFNDGSKRPSRDECRDIVKLVVRDYLKLDHLPELKYDEYGKPCIERYEGLAVSYAHSKQYLAIALQPHGGAVGIDTEPLDRYTEVAELKNQAFSGIELETWSVDQYIQLWCLKEAAVKRLGKGFFESEPSEITFFKNSNKSYRLYIGERETHSGYFFNAIFEDNMIAVCTEAPADALMVYRKTLKDMHKE